MLAIHFGRLGYSLAGLLRCGAAMDVSRPVSARPSAAANARSGSTCSTRAWQSAAIDKELYAWYRELRRYGTVPLTGFSLGFERTIACVTLEVLRVRSSGQAKSRPAARNSDGGECFNNRPVICSGN